VNTLRLVAFAFVSAAGLAVGRGSIGESETSCMTKYGPEFEVRDNLGFDVVGDRAASFHVKFAQGPFILRVTFLNGIDLFEQWTKDDATGEIADEQKLALLQAESAGQSWKKDRSAYRTDRSDQTSGSETWLRSDGATATCWMSGKLTLKNGWREIDFSTRQYAAAQKALDQQDGAR
jgi:hypothetical protein